MQSNFWGASHGEIALDHSTVDLWMLAHKFDFINAGRAWKCFWGLETGRLKNGSIRTVTTGNLCPISASVAADSGTFCQHDGELSQPTGVPILRIRSFMSSQVSFLAAGLRSK